MHSYEKDVLGKLAKSFEAVESERKLDPSKWTMVRCDGRAFHSFCQGFQKPYDPEFVEIMRRTAERLLEKIPARFVYVQSDEISLGFAPISDSQQFWFGGRIQKITSSIASLCSVIFLQEYQKSVALGNIKEKESLPTFDCRVWNVPTPEILTRSILWRMIDARKNAVSVVASWWFSESMLSGKKTRERKRMILEKGIVYDQAFPARFRFGSLFVKQITSRKLQVEELEKLPLQHFARKNPDLVFERHEIQEVLPIKPGGFASYNTEAFNWLMYNLTGETTKSVLDHSSEEEREVEQDY